MQRPHGTQTARRAGRIEAPRDFRLAAIEAEPDATPAELRDRLSCARGETFGVSIIHDVFHRHGVSFKRRQRMPANRSAKM